MHSLYKKLWTDFDEILSYFSLVFSYIGPTTKKFNFQPSATLRRGLQRAKFSCNNLAMGDTKFSMIRRPAQARFLGGKTPALQNFLYPQSLCVSHCSQNC